MSSFEADATVGLAYMHKKGIVHLDQKLANTLVCSSPDKPSGFIGKVVDLGLCCGELGYARGVSDTKPSVESAIFPLHKIE